MLHKRKKQIKTKDIVNMSKSKCYFVQKKQKVFLYLAFFVLTLTNWYVLHSNDKSNGRLNFPTKLHAENISDKLAKAKACFSLSILQINSNITRIRQRFYLI